MRAFFLAFASCIFLSGCSNHPLVDDTTRLSTYDIVRKVRCEAHDELHRDLVSASQFDRFQEFENLRESIAAREKAVRAHPKPKNLKDLEDQVNALKAQLAAVEPNTKSKINSLQKQKAILKASVDHTLKEVELLVDDLKHLNDQDNDQLSAIQAKADSILADVGKLANEQRRLAQRKQEVLAEDKYLTDQISLDSAALTCKANTYDPASKTCPESKDFHALNAYNSDAEQLKKDKTILTKPDSENEKIYGFATTNLAMQFRFEITEDDNGSADGSIVWPVALGSITLGYSAGKQKARFAERTVAVSEDFSALLKIKDCDPVDYSFNALRAHVYPITGNIGLGELIEQYYKIHAAQIGLATAEKAKDPNKSIFHDKLQFTTLLKGGLKPSLVLSPSTGHKVTFNGDFNADRKDLHEVIVDIAPGSVPKSAEDKVAASKVTIDTVPELQLRLVQDPEEASLRPLASGGWQVRTTTP